MHIMGKGSFFFFFFFLVNNIAPLSIIESDTITVPFIRVVFSIVADWIIADMLAVRQNALGHVRYVLKDGLKWLPLYGWYFSQVDLCSLFLNGFIYNLHKFILFVFHE